jgi:hypothetical protein
VSESSFVPEEAGRHALRIQGEGGRLNVRAELDVLPAPAERVGAPAHPDLWRDVAAMTGGASGGIEAWDDLLRRIDLLPEAEAIEVRFRLWCHPAWGGLILILLAIYWTARKAAGMV